MIDTGAARFAVLDGEALVAETEVLGAVPVKIMHNSGRGAYVVDQQGRRARLGGPLSEMQSSFKVGGPQWTVLRREGWYVADDGQRIARGIVWLHFFGGSPFVKLVHRLVLTEDTNRIWFKDIGIEFQTAFAGDQAVFDTAAAGGTPAAVPLRAGRKPGCCRTIIRISCQLMRIFPGAAVRRDRTGNACRDGLRQLVRAGRRRGRVARDLAGLCPAIPQGIYGDTRRHRRPSRAGRCGREAGFPRADPGERILGRVVQKRGDYSGTNFGHPQRCRGFRQNPYLVVAAFCRRNGRRRPGAICRNGRPAGPGAPVPQWTCAPAF